MRHSASQHVFRIGAAICAFLLFVGAGVAPDRAKAETPDKAARNVLVDYGFDTFLDGMVASLGKASDQMVGRDPSAATLWTKTVQRHFQRDEMLDEIATVLARDLDPVDLDAARRFIVSPLGQRVTALERAAQAPVNQDHADEEGRRIFSDLIANEDPRLDVYADVIEAMGTVEGGTAAAMNLSIAVLSGMGASDALPYSLTEDQVLAIVQAQRPAIAASVRENAFGSMAYTYRDLSDDELARYAAFLTSTEGRAFYAVTNTGIGEAVSQRAFSFGKAMAAAFDSQTL